MNLLFIDSHFVPGYTNAPLLDQINDELHCLIFQYLLRVLFVKVVFKKNLFHEFGVNVCSFPFYHVERLTVHEFLLNDILRQATLVLDVVDDTR